MRRTGSEGALGLSGQALWRRCCPSTDAGSGLNWLAVALAFVAILGPGGAAPAFAHATGVAGGFESGLLHPVAGFDHLLAMFAVGVWGAQLGGKAVWSLPVTFPMMMAVGGALGMAGVAVGPVEIAIALSVVALGLAIAAAWRAPQAAALALVAVFALYHGHAHGTELPIAAEPVAYSIGFVIATGLIHLAGIGFGAVTRSLFDGWVARGAGALIAAAGLSFLVA